MNNNYELKEIKEQFQQEYSTLNSLIFKISRATTTEEILNLLIRANIYLSNICRDREYIIDLEKDKKQEV